MEQRVFKSTNLKFVAYLLSIGIDYDNIEFTTRHKRIMFSFANHNFDILLELYNKFSDSSVVINVQDYELKKNELFKIKEKMKEL